MRVLSSSWFRTVPVLTVVTLVSLGLAGCAEDDASPKPVARPSSASSNAPAAPAAPAVGSCHQLSVDQASTPVDASPPVDCAGPHTSQTYRVGVIDQLADGHLLSIDSDAVRTQVDRACTEALPDFLGGETGARYLSQARSIWFTPSVEQADAGASWYRCDVVVLASAKKLMPLPPKLRGILDDEEQAARLATCGTTAPDDPGFATVACAQEHSWRAISALPLDPKAPYLDTSEDTDGNNRCKDEAAGRAGDSLKYTWSFVWPTREQWDSGEHRGYCWVPED